MSLPAQYQADEWLSADAGVPAAQPFTADELEIAWTEWSGYSPMLADVMLLLARTGLRWSEARAVTVADTTADAIVVDKSASEGRIVQPLPDGAARTVPLATRIRPLVHRLVAGRDDDELLFTTSLGAPLRRAAVLRRLNWSETGHGRCLDDLRHTAARLWLEEGADPAAVQEWLGAALLVA